MYTYTIHDVTEHQIAFFKDQFSQSNQVQMFRNFDSLLCGYPRSYNSNLKAIRSLQHFVGKWGRGFDAQAPPFSHFGAIRMNQSEMQCSAGFGQPNHKQVKLKTTYQIQACLAFGHRLETIGCPSHGVVKLKFSQRGWTFVGWWLFEGSAIGLDENGEVRICHKSTICIFRPAFLMASPIVNLKTDINTPVVCWNERPVFLSTLNSKSINISSSYAKPKSQISSMIGQYSCTRIHTKWRV